MHGERERERERGGRERGGGEYTIGYFLLWKFKKDNFVRQSIFYKDMINTSNFKQQLRST